MFNKKEKKKYFEKNKERLYNFINDLTSKIDYEESEIRCSFGRTSLRIIFDDVKLDKNSFSIDEFLTISRSNKPQKTHGCDGWFGEYLIAQFNKEYIRDILGLLYKELYSLLDEHRKQIQRKIIDDKKNNFLKVFKKDY